MPTPKKPITRAAKAAPSPKKTAPAPKRTAPAEKPAAPEPRQRTRGLDPDARIVIVASANPRKPGSRRHGYFEIAAKVAAKSGTVAAYRAAGGHMPSLRTCVDRGWIKVG